MRTTLGGRAVRSSLGRTLESVLTSAQAEVRSRLERTALGYCRECRMKVEMLNPKRITVKRSCPPAKDVCPKCGTKVFFVA